MDQADDADQIPAWVTSGIRRAAVFTALSWSAPFAAAAALFLAIAGCLAYGVFDSKFPPLFWMTVFLAAMGLLGWELFKSLRLILRPAGSEEIAYLRRFGSFPGVADRVGQELQNPINARFGKEAVVAQEWLVVSGGRRFAVRRLDDLVWVFPRKTTIRLAWVIPVWRTHTVEFRFAVGPDAVARCSEEAGAELLDHLARRFPWVALGDTEETERLWDHHRETLVEAVREKRRTG
ncbi:MAG: hypothetical protein HY748_10950 [Elusimicrobia bacterium]|nr:hypothetical protein [Elusimicrobiota bacterium]